MKFKLDKFFYIGQADDSGLTVRTPHESLSEPKSSATKSALITKKHVLPHLWFLPQISLAVIAITGIRGNRLTMKGLSSLFLVLVSCFCVARGDGGSEDVASADPVRKRRQLVYNVADGSAAAMNKVRGFNRFTQNRDLFAGEDEKVFLNRLLFDSQDSLKSPKAPKPERKFGETQ